VHILIKFAQIIPKHISVVLFQLVIYMLDTSSPLGMALKKITSNNSNQHIIYYVVCVCVCAPLCACVYIFPFAVTLFLLKVFFRQCSDRCFGKWKGG
jgi:hypothetical protein